MKWLIFLLSYFLFVDSFARVKPSINPLKCPGLAKIDKIFYKSYLESYDDQSYEGDVEKKLLLKFDDFKSNCKHQRYRKAFETKMEKIIKRGWNSQVDFIKDEISRVSDYRLPNEELEQLDVFAKKVGKNRSQIISEKYLNELISDSKRKRDKIKSSCTNKDNRKPPLGNKVRDQDGVGWCYAYTAADLISHKIGTLVSAIDVANSFNNSGVRNYLKFDLSKKNESDQRGGYTDDAIESSIARGVCSEKNVRSSDFAFQQDEKLIGALRRLENLKERFDEETVVTASSRRFWDLKHLSESRSQKIKKFVGDCSILNGGFRQIFNNLTNDQMIDILRRSMPVDVVNQAIKESCKNKRLVIEDVEVETKSINLLTSVDDLIDELDSQLNNDNIVGITYYASLLRNPYNDKSENHESSIVARKFDEKSGSCKYLIRNSWGEGCGSYSRKYECEKGQIWIPQERLVEMIHGITYIK